MPIRAVCLSATLFILSLPSTSQAQWGLEMLGPLNGRQTVAAALNDRGDVVGHSWNADGVQIPFLWTRKAGYLTFLGDVTGLATDINNRGEVVGVQLSTFAGFLWSEAGGLVNLGAGFWPTSINEAGVIAGSCDSVSAEDAGPCVWERGALRSLHVPFGGSALAVNEAATVVGNTFLPGTDREMPFVWGENRGLQMLPVPSGTYFGLAEGINNAGVAVGWSLMLPDDNGYRHQPLVWDRRGRIQQTLDVNGIAVGINNRGFVIGVSPALRFEDGRGFVWTRGGDLVFLPGGEANLPADINGRGDVAGSIYTDGIWYAALWRNNVREQQ